MVTMLLGGLWHGAGWTFVLWGGLHGARVGRRSTRSATGRRPPAWLGWLVTFHIVVLGWILFRAATWRPRRRSCARLVVAGSATLATPAIVAIVVAVIARPAAA